MTLKARALRRLRQYRCRSCGERFARRNPYCPTCKAVKGTNGQRVTWERSMG